VIVESDRSIPFMSCGVEGPIRKVSFQSKSYLSLFAKTLDFRVWLGTLFCGDSANLPFAQLIDGICGNEKEFRSFFRFSQYQVSPNALIDHIHSGAQLLFVQAAEILLLISNAGGRP